MRRIIKVLVLIFSIIILTLTIACTATNNKSVEKEDNLKGKITILTDKKHEQQLRLVADNFRKAHPKVEIDLMVEDNTNEKLQSKLNDKENSVDILSFDDQYVQYFLNKMPNAFLDVTDDISSFKDRFLKSKIDNLTFNNKVYGFPWTTSPKVIIYRADILSKEGINPDDIKTWNDYIEVGKKVSKETGKKFMANVNDINNDTYLLLANQLGTSYFNKDGKLNFNSKEWASTLQVVKSFYSEGIIYDLNSKEEVIDTAKKDKIVSFVADPSYISSLMQNAPELKGKWGIMKFPAFEPGGNRDVSFGGSNLIINKNSPNTILAKEFVKFAITDEKTQMDALDKYGNFPANTDIYNLVAFNKGSDYFNEKIWYLFSNIEKGAQATNYTPYFPNIREVEEGNLSQSTLSSNEIPLLLDTLQKAGESKITQK